MLKGDSAYLLSVLAQYGYSLLQPEKMADPNELLAKLSLSEDARLLEGFPVVLANAMEKHRHSLSLKTAESLLNSDEEKSRFRNLAALSCHLFRLFGLTQLLPRQPEYRLDSKFLDSVRSSVERNLPLRLGNRELSVERLKQTFLNYYVHSKEMESAERRENLREEFRKEFYLSLFFAPKQRDLLKKTLRGDSLTKTEREYYSRVVKKKLLALADPDLHRLAQKALQAA